jgi:rod shape-determining protein MreD
VIRRVFLIALVLVTALLLQSTLFADLRLLGVRPELLYLVTIVFALLEGPNQGAVIGFVSGMAQDFMLHEPKGITALTLTLLGYAVGTGRHLIVSASPLVPTMVVAIGTAAGLAFYEVTAFLLGAFDEGPTDGAKIALLAALYNAVLTPIVYPLLRRVSEASRPKRVVRF